MAIVDARPENTPDTHSNSGAPATGHAVRDYFSTDEIFQRVAASAEEEFELPIRLLFFGGLAAGLSIGLSFYARAAITAESGSAIIGNLLYPIGFLLIVIGRYQLFTENTLTPVTLVLARIASLPKLLLNWGIVLAANIVGAAILALFLAFTPVLSSGALTEAIAIGEHALGASWGELFVKGIVAGWLVASMVWLVHAARDTISRVFLVFFIMYIVPTADLYHCIIGICEALFMYFSGLTTFGDAIFGFFLPVLLGNTVGGVLLVAILNFAQTQHKRFPKDGCAELELTWREWLLEIHAGRPEFDDMKPDEQIEYGYLHQEPTDADAILGNADAPITLVQYGDYECPDSLTVYEATKRLSGETDTSVRYVFRHLPLGSHHPHAIRAASAAEAAGTQDKFWEMHDKLFSNQEHLEESDLMRYARQLELDLGQFKADMDDSAIRNTISQHREMAVENGVFSSNNLFVNGKRYTGQYTSESIIRYILQLEQRLEKSAA